MIEIESAFNTRGSSVIEFYQRPGIGLYIPLYQREYSWDSDNIEQLLDDIARGLERMIENGEENEIRFLGTIITVIEKDKNNIEPLDQAGLPSAVEKIIDGQQRLSTICLFATQLYALINSLKNKIPLSYEHSDELKEICDSWLFKLEEVISLDLKKGTPKLKPQIIRGHDDKWVKDSNIEEAYKSDLANYLAHFIEYIIDNSQGPPKPNRSTTVGKNTRQINKWLEDEVALAHISDRDDFPPAWELINRIEEERIWEYSRPHLRELVLKKKYDNKRELEFTLCSLIQIFSVCHYLLERCCFTCIIPSNDDWAFDMFQSLNASGTPLTAIETFKPLVVNTFYLHNSRKEYKNSVSDKGFQKIEDLFTDTNTAAQKSKRTNEFLTSLAIVVEGYKLTSHFSHQRKWLGYVYNGLENFSEKESYIGFLGSYANFYKDIWIDYSGADNKTIEIISSHPIDAELVSMLILYLKKSNHKMAATILGSFYAEILNGTPGSIQNFIEATKAIAAFYTIWRSTRGNSGLDNVYRLYFKGETDIDKEINVDSHSWFSGNNHDPYELKKYLRDILKKLELDSKDNWTYKASEYLTYQSRAIVKFILMLSSHDTIPDSERPGLMKKSSQGVIDYLNVRKWNSKGVATIEHIAPQNGKDAWDKNLYTEDKELYQTIGNLTLLPTEVNISASNKGWKEKSLYYKHLSEKDPSKIQELKIKAEKEGIELDSSTVEILQNAQYNDHIKSLVTYGEEMDWSSEIVEARSMRILEIAWDRMENWLS
jgi:hypothetical protein